MRRGWGGVGRGGEGKAACDSIWGGGLDSL